MEIRQVLRGNQTGFAPARPAESRQTGAGSRPAADRVELSRRWVEQMEEQSARMKNALLAQGKKEDEGGILGCMKTEEDKLDALSEALDVQMKCMKIAANIMKGKKVPPEDEQYLMEHDPEGYKLTMAMRRPPKDDEECDSVLDEEDRSSGETSETGEAAPAEGGGDAPSSGGGEGAV